MFRVLSYLTYQKEGASRSLKYKQGLRGGMDLETLVKYIPFRLDWLWIGPVSGILLIGLVKVFFSVFGTRGQKHASHFDHPDRQELYGYWRSGYNLETAQLVNFYLSFDSEESAGKVFWGLTRNFNIIESKLERNGDRWLLTIALRVILSLEKIEEIQREISAAAQYVGGTYDGWTILD